MTWRAQRRKLSKPRWKGSVGGGEKALVCSRVFELQQVWIHKQADRLEVGDVRQWRGDKLPTHVGCERVQSLLSRTASNLQHEMHLHELQARMEKQRTEAEKYYERTPDYMTQALQLRN